MKKGELILIGGGGHCKSCIDVIEQEGLYDIAGIVDLKEKLGQSVLGYKVFATDNDLIELTKSYKYFLITIGHIKTCEQRIIQFNRLKEFNIVLPVVVSPTAYVSSFSKIGEGTIIMHHALINAAAVIGKNCIINTKALIEHDAKIGDHCHISTGAIINGGVKIGKQTFFGSGAVSKQSVDIPENSFIKANSIFQG